MLVFRKLNASFRTYIYDDSLNYIRPIQRFLKIRPSSLTFLNRSSSFFRCSGCVHTNVTSGISFGVSRIPGILLSFSARARLLLRFLAAFPFHSSILKPDLHLRKIKKKNVSYTLRAARADTTRIYQVIVK